MAKTKISNRVYEKDFTVKSMGYDCREVDDFLDEINEQIEKLERENANLYGENVKLESDKKHLVQKNYELESANAKLVASKGSITSSNTNYNDGIDLIERLSALEVKVQKLIDYIEKNNKS